MSDNGYVRPRNEAEKVERRLARYPLAIEMVDNGTARPKVVAAVALLRSGLMGLEIAKAMNLSRSQAYQLLNDPTDERNKERKSAFYGTCADCGGPTAYQAGGAAERCFRCTQRANRIWPPERILEVIREYARRYGRPPLAHEWNPAPANRLRIPNADWDEVDRRWAAGDWPYTTTVLYHHGTWNAAIEAAGFESVAPGHYRRNPRPGDLKALA